MAVVEEKEEFARHLKSRHVQLIAIGGTIGTGLFLGAGQSIHLAGPSILLAYALTGLIGFWIMRALGELLVSDVNSHSFIDFINKYLGEKIGFVAGWTYWICWVAIAMAEVTAIGLYVRFWVPTIPQWLPGLIVLVVLLGINLIAVGLFGEIEFWFSLIKIIAIVALIVIGIVLTVIGYKTNVGHASVSNLVDNGGLFPNGIRGFILSFQMVMFSFVGIEMVGLTASEAENPKVTIPKAINDIPLRIIIFYIGALAAIMCIYPWQAVSPTSSPFVQVFENVGIPFAASIINFVVLTAAASACNSSIFSTGRMLFSLMNQQDRQDKLTKRLGSLSKRKVPANALFFSTGVIAVAVLLNLAFPEDVFTIVTSVATTCFLFIWGAIVIAHLKYKKTQEAQKSIFKMPLFPVANYLTLAFLFFVGIVLCLNKATFIALLLSLVWLVGLYLAKSRTMRRA